MEQSAEESWGSSSGGGDFFSDAGLNSCGVWAAARGAPNDTMQLNAVRAHTKASAKLLRFRFIQATPRSRGTRVSYRITTRSPSRRKAWARVSLLRNRSHPLQKMQGWATQKFESYAAATGECTVCCSGFFLRRIAA